MNSLHKSRSSWVNRECLEEICYMEYMKKQVIFNPNGFFLQRILIHLQQENNGI